MAAGKHDITLEQGATYNMQVRVEENGSPVDITNYTFESQVRKSHYSSDVAASFTTSLVNGPMGSFNISLTDTQTDALNPAFTHVYDVEVTSDTGAVTRIIEGTVTVSPGVTR
jgi:hypothetical protein